MATPRPEPLAPPASGESNSMGVLALVFGILSFVCLGPIGGILAVVFGILGLAKAKQLEGRGRGMSIAGIVLAIVNFVVTIGVVILIIVLATATSHSMSIRSGDPASPSTYEVGITNCSVDALGSANFNGVIRNTTESRRSFMVSTEITDSFGTTMPSFPSLVIDIPPGGSRPWQAMTFTDPVGDITCRVIGVDNLLN
ncbi:MAG: DUF4190 domain-containing protein [Acidimicrobiia bacterium]|nr:DUF4190 domain-containing protein [Acidimicrobiia bacterium]